MAKKCNHNNYSMTWHDCCEVTDNPHCKSKDWFDENHCTVGTCDNCDKIISHDYGEFDDTHNDDLFTGKPVDVTLSQQFRDILHFGGASDALDNVSKEQDESKEEDEDEVGGYNCRVCGRWSATLDENMNHRCFEE